MAEQAPPPRRLRERFHGRVPHARDRCAWEGCAEPGEFRAPRGRAGEVERWYCLDHIRPINEAWDWFAGMTPDEVRAAQRPGGMDDWRQRHARASAAAFDDPHELLRGVDPGLTVGKARPGLTVADHKALAVMGLDETASSTALAKRYKDLVRRYHPDANGGDRSGEQRLSEIINAYNHLRQQAAFKGR